MNSKRRDFTGYRESSIQGFIFTPHYIVTKILRELELSWEDVIVAAARTGCDGINTSWMRGESRSRSRNITDMLRDFSIYQFLDSSDTHLITKVV